MKFSWLFLFFCLLTVLLPCQTLAQVVLPEQAANNTPPAVLSSASVPEDTFSTQSSLRSSSPVVAAPESYHARWARQSVEILEANGIVLPNHINYSELISRQDYLNVLARIAGVSKGQLVLPEESHLLGEITRSEAIHRVVLAFGLGAALPDFARQDSHFRDITRQHPAYGAIVLAEKLKLIDGYPDQTIRPNERLSWGEALILIETLYSWRKALPTDAPQWVRNYQKRQNMWYQLIDGFRLLLTLAYVGIALFFFVKSWRRTRHQQRSPFRSLSVLLAMLTLLLALMWINDILFNYHLIPREMYALGSLISIFIALLMLKTGTHLDNKLSEPKPQAVIDTGYVEAIHLEKGELFVKDMETQNHCLAIVSPDTHIISRLDGKATTAFFSEIRPGDLISLKGASAFQGSVIEVERLSIVQRQKQATQQEQVQWQSLQQTQAQPLENRMIRRLPRF